MLGGLPVARSSGSAGLISAANPIKLVTRATPFGLYTKPDALKLQGHSSGVEKKELVKLPWPQKHQKSCAKAAAKLGFRRSLLSRRQTTAFQGLGLCLGSAQEVRRAMVGGLVLGVQKKREGGLP